MSGGKQARRVWQCKSGEYLLKKALPKEGVGGVGGRNSPKFYLGGRSLEVQSLFLLYTIFCTKGTPFVCLPLTNGTAI